MLYELFNAASTLPTVLFSFLLIVVIVYWLLLLVGGAILERTADGHSGGALARVLAIAGLGGVPVSFVLSLLVLLSWVASLVATVASGEVGSFVAALVIAWLGTALLLRPLRGAVAAARRVRPELVGDVCIVRTGEVGPEYGQAEVSAVDGSPTVIQVRQYGSDDLRAGAMALIYDYDADGDVFWITSFDPELGAPT